MTNILLITFGTTFIVLSIFVVLIYKQRKE